MTADEDVEIELRIERSASKQFLGAHRNCLPGRMASKFRIEIDPGLACGEMGWFRGAGANDATPALRYRYCHPCGYEYVPTMTMCTDCGRTLVAEPLPAPPPPPVREHGTASVSVAGLDALNRDLLEMRLRGEEIPMQWFDDAVVVPAVCAAATHDLVAELVQRGGDADRAARGVPVPHATVASTLGGARRNRMIAGRWQRVGGSFVDSVAISLSNLGLARLGVSWWLIGIVDGLYWVVATKVSGATIGKLVAGTRVTVAGERPSWWASSVRWAITGWIGFATGISTGVDPHTAWVIGALALMTWLVAYAPIVWDADGRGLHDRLAGTVVVRTGQRHRS